MVLSLNSDCLTPSEQRALGGLMERTQQSDLRSAFVARSRQLLAEFGKVTPAFDPEALGYIQKIRVQRKDIPFDACLIPVPEGYRVEVCRFHSAGRQNFSIAHEIAHTFLIESNPELRKPQHEVGVGSTANHRLVEHFCDVAASEMLWPNEVFSHDVFECGPSLQGIIDLARRYKTSLTATARRFIDTNMWKCSVIVWEHSAEAGLKARYAYQSSSGARIERASFAARPGSTAHEAYRSGGIAKGRDTFIIGGSPRKCYCEAIKLGRGDYGAVLSLVSLMPHAEQLASFKKSSPQLSLRFR